MRQGSRRQRPNASTLPDQFREMYFQDFSASPPTGIDGILVLRFSSEEGIKQTAYVVERVKHSLST